MALENRIALIKRIEEIRGSTVICYLTSLRPNISSQISQDAVRVFFDHLMQLPSRPVDKLDIFLCSNGGDGTVPWRLVALFREYGTSFNVLIPYRAYSAASLIALGADEIVMHPFAELGPIDPSVSNEFNPTHPVTGQPLAISVEDVTAYVNFIKTTVGITHEDELVKAIEILAEKVHPLALGNVERFLTQSRMIARKILRTHMSEENSHTIDEIVENMASKLYFHGHPINRKEAKDELHLKVVKPEPDLEGVMWDLYREYEAEFKNTEIFSPASDLAALPTAAPQIIPQNPGMPGMPGMPQQALVVSQASPEKEYDLLLATIESNRLSSVYTLKRRFQLLPIAQTGQQMIKQDDLAQGWTHSPVPTPGQEAPPSLTSAEGAPQGGTE